MIIILAILFTGWNTSDGRLGREFDDDNSMIPMDVPMDEVGNSAVTQFSIAGSGGILLASSTPSAGMMSKERSLWMWGKIPSSDDSKLGLRRWREPWMGHTGTDQKIDIVSICLSCKGLGVVTVVWSGVRLDESVSSAKVPKLDFTPLSCGQSVSPQPNPKELSSDQRIAAPGLHTSVNAVSEFWNRWGADPTAAVPTQIVKDLSDQIGQSAIHHQSNRSASLSEVARSYSKSDRPVPKLIISPGTVISTIQSVSSSDSLLRSSQSKELTTTRGRISTRHAFLNPVVPRLKTGSQTNEGRLWSALDMLGKSKAMIAMKEVLSDMARDIKGTDGSGVDGSGVESMSKLDNKMSGEFEADDEKMKDELSIIPKLSGPDWQVDPLKSVKRLIIKFEKFRRTATEFWQNCLIKAQYNIVAESQSIKSVVELRDKFIKIRQEFSDYFELSSGMFSLHQLPNLTYWSLRQSGRRPFAVPRAWAAVRLALVEQWSLSGGSCVAVRISNRGGEISTVESNDYSDRSSLSDSKTGDQEMRLKKARVEAFRKVGGNVADDDDVPIQDWEVTPDLLSIIDVRNILIQD